VKKKKSTYTIREVLNEYFSKNKPLAYRIKSIQALEMWETVVDEYTHLHTSAVALNEGLLIVNADSAPLANDLSLKERELREKLNRKLAFPVVKKIVFKSGYIPKNKSGKMSNYTKKKDLSLGTIKKIEDTVKGVKEEELREILKRFLFAAAKRTRSKEDPGGST
jgi:hypothetical protein